MRLRRAVAADVEPVAYGVTMADASESETAFICATCGIQYPPSAQPPAQCLICEDERQYIPREGQRWTTLDELRATHRNVIDELEPGLLRIVTEPSFAIGQYAYLVTTPGGNILWECLSLVDAPTVEALRQAGGVAAIAISHPHFYASCVEWSTAFDHAPIHLPAVDRDFVVRPDSAIVHFESDEIDPLPGVRVLRLGGHFHGSAVLHWPAGAGGRGVLLTGDTIALVSDPHAVTFMYSYPNRIPLPAATVRGLAQRIAQLRFDRIYASAPQSPEWTMLSGARDAVLRSAERYAQMVDGTWPRR
jgi:hypothetical protein